MAKAAITKRTVDAAKKAAKDYFIWDDEVAGFGLKVTPASGKIYVFQYRMARPGQADRTAPIRYTIGKHGRLTPDQARKRAKALAALVEQGIDPRQQERDERAARDEAERLAEEKSRIESDLAFEKIAGLWLDYYENERACRPSTLRLAKLVVTRYLLPHLTGKPVPHISRADLQTIIDSIPSAKRATRKAVFSNASVLFGWALKRGDIARNPLADMIKPAGAKARDRVLTDDELVVVWKASQTMAAPYGPFFRLLVLTGQRRSEVAAMNWAELDRATATWTIPAERAKNGVVHIVPLSDSALAELDKLAEAVQTDPSGDDPKKWPKAGFVLSSTGRTHIVFISKGKATLDGQITKARDGAALPDWRIHDLRRTLATGLQRLGVRFEVTESILNHVSGAKGGIAGVYQRHDWKEEKRSALDAWARHVEAILKPKDKENVVSFDAAKRSA